MPTKHEQIIQYIENLPIGNKVSVRRIAKQLSCSEGTAYRAIKEAENRGIVSTIERVGTIRIEKKAIQRIENLTFSEIEKIIEGKVLGGMGGIHKSIERFVIGAMQEDAMLKYITNSSLMIVGNRVSVQKLALESGSAVLITGGFETTSDIIELAERVNLPIMTTSYDTFTVATLINRAMSDQLIRKEIVIVDHIYTPLLQTQYLMVGDTIEKYRALSQLTDHSRFPVVNAQNRLVGIVTSKDIMDKADSMLIERVMTKSPVVAKTHMSIASVSHMMIWDGLDILPVVEDNLQLIGIISRRDVLKAIQLSQRQPQIGNTINDQIISNLEILKQETNYSVYQFLVEPQMLSSMGTISYGVLSEIIYESAQNKIYEVTKQQAILEQVQLHYFKTIQNESNLKIICEELDISKRISKIEVTVYCENLLMAKAIVSYQMIEM